MGVVLTAAGIISFTLTPFIFPDSSVARLTGASLVINLACSAVVAKPEGGKYVNFHLRVTSMLPLGRPVGSVSSNVPGKPSSQIYLSELHAT